MTDQPSVAQLPLFPETLLPPKMPRKSASLHTYWCHMQDLPAFVRGSPTILRCLELIGPLDWDGFPERNVQRNWGQPTLPYTALVAAELIRLNEDLPSTKKLRRFLVEHSGFIWLLGGPLVPAPNHPPGFNAQASLPTQRHLNRLFRQLPNPALQFLLADSVRLILAELAARGGLPIECISLDTKHILAWVKENNPKDYVSDRFNKDKQPAGDPDCRLGCKRRHNRVTLSSTPTRNPVPAKLVKAGEYYWGYGSGAVVAKVPDWGEFVIAEMTNLSIMAMSLTSSRSCNRPKSVWGTDPGMPPSTPPSMPGTFMPIFTAKMTPTLASPPCLFLRRATTKPNSGSSRRPVNRSARRGWSCR